MSGENAVVRPMMIEDVDRVEKLYAELDQLHSDALPWLFQLNASARPLSFYRESVDGHDSAMLVAELSGEVVGFAYVVLRTAPPKSVVRPRKWGELVDIHVSKPYRRRRVGQLLLSAVERWVVTASGDSLELNVYDFNAGAIGFFESAGFDSLSRELRKRLGGDE